MAIYQLPLLICFILTKLFTETKVLHSNLLNSELLAAFSEGLSAVKKYLLIKAEFVILSEAKLILVGEGEVGKTRLMDALLDKPWQEHHQRMALIFNLIKVTDLK